VATELVPGEGQYVYFLNGERAVVEESWQVDPVTAGEQSVRSQRKAPGVVLDVNATMVQGLALRCEVCWSADDEVPLHARYAHVDSQLRMSRWEEDGAPITRVLDAAEGQVPILYPWMRIFTGAVIKSLAVQGGQADVVVPSIANPGQRERLLLPDISRRQVSRDGSEDLQLRFGGQQRCELWRFVGGQYTGDASFWLNAEGQLQRYSWKQAPNQQWDVWLA
jgi:hypothetical protein